MRFRILVLPGTPNNLEPDCEPKYTICRYGNLIEHLEIVCSEKDKITALHNVKCMQVDH